MSFGAHSRTTCRAIVKICLVGLVALTLVSGDVIASTNPIKHADGRIRYIVDLYDDDAGTPANFTDANSVIDWHKAKSGQLIDDVVKLRGVELFATTSLVGTSFTAYLTEKQVEQFAKDRRVKLITQDAYLEASAIPWVNTPYYNQQLPWGLQALGVTYAGPSNSYATVYVLDTGVEMHPDLPGLAASDRLTAFSGVNPTGCYSHATHVAGIVGAAWNFDGTVGVLPGVKLVSIAVGDNSAPRALYCPTNGVADGSWGTPISGFVNGLQKVYELVLASGRVGIVNISFNISDGSFSSTGTIGAKMKLLATPTSFFPSNIAYHGAFIAQSAGNQFVDACGFAYDAHDANDGIMVVGGLDYNGQRVVPMNGPTGFRSSPNALDEPGSNTGSCVEVWAPSQRVLSTWTGNGYGVLSGTSMAAPHIAGFAARLLENNGGNYNARTLEAAVRAHLTTIYGTYLAMPQLYPEAVTAIPTIEIVEGPSSSMTTGINFDKLASAVQLKFQAVGAASCTAYVTRNGAYFAFGYVPTTYDFGASSLPAGQYTWTVTCTSPLPDSTQNSVTATGVIRRPVTATWKAMTTSTAAPNGTPQWQTLDNFALVTWAYNPFVTPIINASFDQQYTSENAASCRIESFGFTGSILGDHENPSVPVVLPAGLASYVQSAVLWDSAVYGAYPTAYQFATLNFQDPQHSPYPIAPFDGYKWRLTCNDALGSSQQIKVMYGAKAP